MNGLRGIGTDRTRTLAAQRFVCGLVVGCVLGGLPGWAEDAERDVGCDLAVSFVRTGDSLWLISSRHLGCATGDGVLDALAWRHYDAQQCEWVPASRSAFHAEDRGGRAMVVYVHGNRVEARDAYARGEALYRLLVNNGAAPRLRFVIWSWPSSRTRGPLRDVRFKAGQADMEGERLSRFLDDTSADPCCALYGFSYGARVISSALERRDVESPASRYDVVFYAPAFDRNWLVPGNVHGDVTRQMAWLTIMYNSCDRALKRFHVVDKCTHPIALGYTGISRRSLGEAADRTTEADMCCVVGKAHDEWRYFEAGSARELLRGALDRAVGRSGKRVGAG